MLNTRRERGVEAPTTEPIPVVFFAPVDVGVKLLIAHGLVLLIHLMTSVINRAANGVPEGPTKSPVDRVADANTGCARRPKGSKRAESGACRTSTSRKQPTWERSDSRQT